MTILMRIWMLGGQGSLDRLQSFQRKGSRADGARSREEAFDMAIVRVLYEHQLFKEALVSIKRSCELQPMDVRPHFRAENCLYVLGKYKEAKEEFLLARESAEAGEGMVLSACEYYREAAILCPTHFRALKLLGSALFGVREYRVAVKALEEAIFMKPDYADAHCDLASALHAMGEDERAIEVFQKAIDLKPGHVDALYNLGGLYMDLGRFQRTSKMYTRVLAVWSNHWRAQLNKVVSLLGTGEIDEAKKALKEALKMTNRVELHDAIYRLKQLQKTKLKINGGANKEGAFVIVESSKFKMVGEKTTLRQDLGNALQIRAFQRITRLSRCEVDLLKKEISETNVPLSYSGGGEAVKSINEKILSVFDETGSVIEGGYQIRKVDAVQYIKLLRAIYVPFHEVSEMLEVHRDTNSSMVCFNEFLVMFDDPDWGFGIMSTLLKLETGDRNHHGHHVCSVCCYPLIGSRFKEVKSHFSLCNQCYSEERFPLALNKMKINSKSMEVRLK
ncbi:hypothetical protein CRYUN_Cryun35bG0015500 [Craigia yunnanensis]